MCRMRNRYLLRRTIVVPVATDSQAIRNLGTRSRPLAGAPKKRPGAAIRGGRDTGPRCQTAIEPRSSPPAGATKAPRKSGLGPLFGGGRDTDPRCQTAIEGPGAGLQRGPPRRPEKAAWGRYSGGRDTGPRCQTAIEGHGAGRWRGPPRRPEKAAWGRYSGAGIPAHAAIPQLRATEQGAGGGHQGDPKKRPGAAIRGGWDTGPSALPDRNCGPRAACRWMPPRRPEKAVSDLYLGLGERGPPLLNRERVDEKSV